MDAQLRHLDGLVLPTTPIVAPLIAEVSASFEAFISKDTLGVHNTDIVSSISAQSPRQSTLRYDPHLVRKSCDKKIGAATIDIRRAGYARTMSRSQLSLTERFVMTL
jgi:hypothetical protein